MFLIHYIEQVLDFYCKFLIILLKILYLRLSVRHISLLNLSFPFKQIEIFFKENIQNKAIASKILFSPQNTHTHSDK